MCDSWQFVIPGNALPIRKAGPTRLAEPYFQLMGVQELR